MAGTESSGEKNSSSFTTKTHQWVLILTGIVGIAVAVLGIFETTRGGSVSNGTATTPPPSASVETTSSGVATARFAVPEDGDPLNVPFRARGSANLPVDHSLWILTRPESNTYFTNNATPLTIDMSGEWEFTMSIGRDERDAGKQFDLFLVSGIAEGTEIDTALRDRGSATYASFGSLPDGVTILDHVRVTLAG